jgi:hypothetical protein
MAQFPSQTSANGLWTMKKVKRNLQGANWPTFPGAPTIGTATGGDASASVTFTAPAANGGSVVTGYTVTSSPGGFTGTGATSPITVSGLTNGTSYTFTVKATNTQGTGTSSSASNSVTPAVPVAAWNEAGSGATTTALKTNLLYAGLGNTVYKWYNVATLVQANTNPKSISGLASPANYSGGNYASGSANGMTASAPTKFNSTDGYGTNSFRTANTPAPNLQAAWSGSPNPGIACFWYYDTASGGQHFIGNADCTSRYLLDNHPTGSSWYWVVVDLFNNIAYWNNSSAGSAGGTYSDLFCAFYMGWSNSNTLDGYYHDYRVYQYSAANHSAMVSALRPVPSTAYYTGGV